MSKSSPIHIMDSYFLDIKNMQKLIKTYGTPIYIYNQEIIEKQWRSLRQFLPNDISVYYSVKANPNQDIINIFRQLGTSFEAASKGEIDIIRNHSNNDKVIFVGPAKTKEDIAYAMEKNVYIVAESINEIDKINTISKEKGMIEEIAIRINPGYGSGVLSMGGKTQFGLDIDNIDKLSNKLSDFNNVTITGFHFFLGTGVTDERDILQNTQKILEVSKIVARKLNVDIKFLDIGGGLGIPYYENDRSLNLEKIQNEFKSLINDFCTQNPAIVEIAFESGRYLVGPAGVFVASVVDVKSSYGVNYIVLDGGFNAFGLNTYNYGFKIPPFSVLTQNTTNYDVYTICGPLCSSADKFAVNVRCLTPNEGDIVVFYQAGAYSFSASPGLFLSRGFPKEIMYINDV